MGSEGGKELGTRGLEGRTKRDGGKGGRPASPRRSVTGAWRARRSSRAAPGTGCPPTIPAARRARP